MVNSSLSKYEFTEPGDLHDWSAKVWVVRQKVNLREGRVSVKTPECLKKEIHRVEMEIHAEWTAKRQENKAGT